MSRGICFALAAAIIMVSAAVLAPMNINGPDEGGAPGESSPYRPSSGQGTSLGTTSHLWYDSGEAGTSSVDIREVLELAVFDVVVDILSAEGLMTYPATVNVGNEVVPVIAYTDMSELYKVDDVDCFAGGLVALGRTVPDGVYDIGCSFRIAKDRVHTDVRMQCVLYECVVMLDILEDAIHYAWSPIKASSSDYDAYRAEALEMCQLSRGGLYDYGLGVWLLDTSSWSDQALATLRSIWDFLPSEADLGQLLERQSEGLLEMDIETIFGYSHDALLTFLSSLRTSTVSIGDSVFTVSELREAARNLGPDEVIVMDSEGWTIDVATDPPQKVSDAVRWLTGLACIAAVAASAALAIVVPGAGGIVMGAVIGAASEIFITTCILGEVPDPVRVVMGAAVGALCAIPGVGLIGSSFIGAAGESIVAAIHGGSPEEVLISAAFGLALGVGIGYVVKAGEKIGSKVIGAIKKSAPAWKKTATPVEITLERRMFAVSEIVNSGGEARGASNEVSEDLLMKLRSLDQNNPSDKSEAEVLKREIFGYAEVDDLPEVPVSTFFKKGAGHWRGEPGNSVYFIERSASEYPVLKSLFAEHGLDIDDGLRYINGNPDFHQFAYVNQSPWGGFDSSVVIPDMKFDIDVPLPDGTVKTISGRTNNQAAKTSLKNAWQEDTLVSAQGNFEQADRALAAKLDVSPKDIQVWRKSAGLTWHEVADGITMELLPTVVHDTFKHYGGVFVTARHYGSGEVERSFETLINDWAGKKGLAVEDLVRV